MRAVSDEVRADDQAGAASGEAEPDRFYAVFEALPLMLFEVDNQDRLVWAKAGRATFLLPPEAFLNRRIREVMPPDVAERLVQGFRRARATGEQVLVEYQLSGPGGTRSYCAHLVPRSPTRVATLSSTGPHVHYEIWKNGNPVNPKNLEKGGPNVSQE